MRLLVRPAIGTLAALLAVTGGSPVRGQDPAVQRGVQFLRTQAESQQPGESALAAFAMVKAGVTADDPSLAAYLQKVDDCFPTSSAYTPARPGPAGLSLYEATVIILLYVNLDPVGYRNRIEAVTQYILQNQTANGGWDYAHRMQGDKGDTSISQYAILGLWEAENAGVKIPARVWDRAAQFFISKQGAAGGWNYHRDEPGRADSISMTAAGVGSLLICKRQLEHHRSSSSGDAPSSLLKPVLVDPNAPQGYRPTVAAADINVSVRRGINWMAERWNIARGPIMGESVYYGLYGLERVGALSGSTEIGGHDWFAGGSAYIYANQQGEGSWNDQYNAVPNTAWAILFLSRSTEKSIRRVEIERLGAGTLVGGRGLPKDLTSLTLAGGRVLVRPMNGAIDEMLAVLEDPRAEQADEALAGLIERYHTEGPKALQPHKSRFRKLLADPDPGIRSVAAWGLGRTGDLDVAPDLIAALEDPDDAVIDQARNSLRLLSRKVDGFGPPAGASADQKRAAAEQWRAWYDAIRPPDFVGPVGRSNDSPR